MSSHVVGSIFAAALTYSEHIQETKEKLNPGGPILFIKSQKTLKVSNEKQIVNIPSEFEIEVALNSLEDGLAEKVKDKMKPIPLMFDYEAELGLEVLVPISLQTLKDSRVKVLNDSIAFFAANDLTLRSIQVLGDKNKKKYDYWSVAKSFEGFLPASKPHALSEFSLEAWPQYKIQLWVNSNLRQDSLLSNMVYSPREFLISLCQQMNVSEIPKGTLLITGTPAGIALKISSFKRFIANFFGFSPITKLKFASSAANKAGSLYLKSGDQVRVKIENVGESVIDIR